MFTYHDTCRNPRRKPGLLPREEVVGIVPSFGMIADYREFLVVWYRDLLTQIGGSFIVSCLRARKVSSSFLFRSCTGGIGPVVLSALWKRFKVKIKRAPDHAKDQVNVVDTSFPLRCRHKRLLPLGRRCITRFSSIYAMHLITEISQYKLLV